MSSRKAAEGIESQPPHKVAAERIKRGFNDQPPSQHYSGNCQSKRLAPTRQLRHSQHRAVGEDLSVCPVDRSSGDRRREQQHPAHLVHSVPRNDRHAVAPSAQVGLVPSFQLLDVAGAVVDAPASRPKAASGDSGRGHGHDHQSRRRWRQIYPRHTEDNTPEKQPSWAAWVLLDRWLRNRGCRTEVALPSDALAVHGREALNLATLTMRAPQCALSSFVCHPD